MTLGGVQIRERTAQDNFDFTVEEISARYSDFLHGSSNNSMVTEDQSAEEPAGQTTTHEPESENHTTPDRNIDEWLDSVVREVPSNADPNIHDNISREFNDSNYWKDAVVPTHKKDLDELLKEVDL